MTVLAKAYEPQGVEERIYAAWTSANCFTADPKSAKPAYSIVIPPPNVTGILTMGHVLNNTIQDILVRRARMQGKEVLWLPGTDHAGLATQTAVEKALRKPDELPPKIRETLESLDAVWDKAAGKPKIPLTKHHIPRSDLLELIWSWTRDRGGVIIDQLKKLGCSCDWGRERFTLDDSYHRSVQRAFVDLYTRGYIYRGKRMVNWCPASLTAISDEEIVSTPQKGKLFTMRYEVVEEPGQFLEIATTRPETLMGDTGVAVNPQDPRYSALVGKHVWRPFPRTKIPIVADDHVDFEFGTGVLKVTPAHDKADFEIGLRHHLPIIDVLTPDGKINCPEVPELHGIERFEARKKSAEMLASMGLLVKEEPYENNVGFSERGQVPIEPRLSEQWFLDYRKMLGGRMIEEALRVVRERQIRFWPDRWEKVYAHWLENIQDWCLSRQIVWGHRIPVWYHDGEVLCQIECPGEGWTQDTDCIDTWASSWLWAYATMDDATLKKFYPTSTLVTGPDIIFLWVARMIIAGLEFEPSGTDDIAKNIAFKDVYFTGIIRDKQGRKMSKSLGNSPDPLDLIAQYGADGLRFGLMRIAPQGQDIRFDESQAEQGRNFCNKLWNAVRFRQMQELPNQPLAQIAQPTAYDQWILQELAECITKVNTFLDTFEFSAAAQELYDFFWGDYCDWYIEVAKAQLADASLKNQTCAVMDYVLHHVFRLLHPYAPFVTQELWSGLGFGDNIMFAEWPTQIDPILQGNLLTEKIQHTRKIYDSAGRGRNLRAEYKIQSNIKVKFVLKNASLSDGDVATLRMLTNAETISLDAQFAPAKGTPLVLTALGELYMPLDGLIDVDAEKARLKKELEIAISEITKVKAKLDNPAFAEKVPAKVLEEHQQRLQTWSDKKTQVEELLGSLG